MPLVVSAPPDCGRGLLALPFMDDEPGLLVRQGGTAMIVGWNPDNVQNPGNAAKAALLATMFNLKQGSHVLEQQGFPPTEIILSGGLTKTPDCGQILADVFGTPVTLLQSADEGSCWGAALLAKYRHLKFEKNSEDDWPTFLESIQPKDRRKFIPNSEAQATYQSMYQRYIKLLELQPYLNEVMTK
jgi:sugar (pentulose or hexulose) kinase